MVGCNRLMIMRCCMMDPGQQGFVFQEDEECLIQTGNMAAKKSCIFEHQFLLPMCWGAWFPCRSIYVYILRGNSCLRYLHRLILMFSE